MRNRYKWNQMLTCVWHLQVLWLNHEESICWVRSFPWISWSTSQNQCGWFIHESDLNSVPEFSSLNQWSTVNAYLLSDNYELNFAQFATQSCKRVVWTTLMVYQKAPVPIHCKYLEKSDYFIIQIYSFCAPQKKKGQFLYAIRWVNNEFEPYL